MGCCIPRKKSISFVKINKRPSQIKSTINENSKPQLYLTKSFACLELQKYYLPNPIDNSRSNSRFNTDFYSPLTFQSYKNENRKNKIIKKSMNKLKKLSFLEVNNCPKYFINNKNYKTGNKLE